MRFYQRLFLTFFCLFVFAPVIHATPVTVASITLPDYQMTGTKCSLKLYASDTWTDSNGIRRIGGAVGSAMFFQEVTGTVTNKVCTIPSFQLQSTTDAIDNNQVRITAAIYDNANSKRGIYLDSFQVPATLGASVTWAQITVYNRTAARPPTPTFYSSAEQINTQIAQGLSNTVPKTDTAYQAVAKIKYLSDFVSFGAAVTNIGTTAITTLTVNSAVTATNAVVPKNISLKVEAGGIITVPNGVKLQISANVEASPGQQIFNLIGTGIVDLYDSTVAEIYPEWWGAKINDNADDLPAFQAAVNSTTRLQNPYYSQGGGQPKTIRCLAGNYNWSDALIIKSHINLTCAGQDYYAHGTQIYVAAGKPGIKFLNNIGVDPYVSDDSVFEGFSLLGGVTDTTYRAANAGILINAKVDLRSISVTGFEGDGFFVQGFGAPNGVASLVQISHSKAFSNNGSGLYTFGNDANAGLTTDFNGTENRRYGIYDSSFLGNTYVVTHTRGNLLGSYKTDGPVADNTFIGAYAESDQPCASLGAGTVVFGGTLESSVCADSRGFQIRGTGSGNNSTTLTPFKVAATFQSPTDGKLYLGNNAGDGGFLLGWETPGFFGATGTEARFRFGTSFVPRFYSLGSRAGGNILQLSDYRPADDVFPGSPIVTPQLSFPDGFLVGAGWNNLALQGDYTRITADTGGVLNLKATQSVKLDAPTATLGAVPIVTTTATQALSNKTISGATNTLSNIPESAVTNLTSDLALKANLASPTFTGTPTAPTAAAGTSTTQISTTAFVANSYAPLASPTFTGTISLNGAVNLSRTITPIGTTGAVTINQTAGTVNVAAASNTVTVTNSLVTVNSIITVMPRTNDSTCAVKNYVPAAGGFTINMTANCTAVTSLGFIVTN